VVEALKSAVIVLRAFALAACALLAAQRSASPKLLLDAQGHRF
jgi:hypothetical protein